MSCGLKGLGERASGTVRRCMLDELFGNVFFVLRNVSFRFEMGLDRSYWLI